MLESATGNLGKRNFCNINICKESDYNNSQGKVQGGDIELQTSPHGSEWQMLILPLTPQPLFEDFGLATETQLKHVHCSGCPIACALSTAEVHEVQPNTPPWKRAVVPAGPTCISSFPRSSLVPPLKINKWRGCLWNRCKSLTVKFQKPLQSSSVPPVDKILSHSKQKAAKGLQT